MAVPGHRHPAAERNERLYDLLCGYARRGEYCPPRPELCLAIGLGPSAVGRAFVELVAEGRITVERDYMHQRNVVTICATGERTRAADRNGPRKRATDYSQRNYEMFQMRAEGKSNLEIARRFGLSSVRVAQILKQRKDRLGQPVCIPVDEKRSFCEQCDRLVRNACAWAICGMRVAA